MQTCSCLSQCCRWMGDESAVGASSTTERAAYRVNSWLKFSPLFFGLFSLVLMKYPLTYPPRLRPREPNPPDRLDPASGLAHASSPQRCQPDRCGVYARLCLSLPTPAALRLIPVPSHSFLCHSSVCLCLYETVNR